MNTINNIAWHVKPKDYSAQLAKIKAEMGASCKTSRQDCSKHHSSKDSLHLN